MYIELSFRFGDVINLSVALVSLIFVKIVFLINMRKITLLSIVGRCLSIFNVVTGQQGSTRFSRNTLLLLPKNVRNKNVLNNFFISNRFCYYAELHSLVVAISLHINSKNSKKSSRSG